MTQLAEQLEAGAVERKASFDKRSFEAGYLIAVANICNMHDEPVIALDVLGDLGVSRSVLRGLDLSDYDLKPLRKLFAELERESRERRRAHATEEQPHD